MNDNVSSDPVVVLYIGGDGRSGSTILSALLGNHDGFFPVGELRGIWRALQTDELCGCGETFSRCEFWRQVGAHAFGGWTCLDTDAIASTDDYFGRHRHLPSIVASRRGRPNDELSEYCRVLGRLYAAIREVSGCSVIVDSTKDPPYAFVLRRVPGLDLRFVHLLRDSRGVAYSWNKKGIRVPEHAEHSEFAFLPNAGPWRSAIKWAITNVTFSCVTRAAPRRVVRYEDLVSVPTQEISRVVRLATGTRAPRGATSEPRPDFRYRPFHTIGGNPVRFSEGAINLHADYEWKTKMQPTHKLIVSALTLPLLLAYRYVTVPGRSGLSLGRR